MQKQPRDLSTILKVPHNIVEMIQARVIHYGIYRHSKPVQPAKPAEPSRPSQQSPADTASTASKPAQPAPASLPSQPSQRRRMETSGVTREGLWRRALAKVPPKSIGEEIWRRMFFSTVSQILFGGSYGGSYGGKKIDLKISLGVAMGAVMGQHGWHIRISSGAMLHPPPRYLRWQLREQLRTPPPKETSELQDRRLAFPPEQNLVRPTRIQFLCRFYGYGNSKCLQIECLFATPTADSIYCQEGKHT